MSFREPVLSEAEVSAEESRHGKLSGIPRRKACTELVEVARNDKWTVIICKDAFVENEPSQLFGYLAAIL